MQLKSILSTQFQNIKTATHLQAHPLLLVSQARPYLTYATIAVCERFVVVLSTCRILHGAAFVTFS